MIPKILLKDMLGNKRETQKVCLFVETNCKGQAFYKIEGMCGSTQFRLLTTYDKEKALDVFGSMQEALLQQQLERIGEI